MFEREVTFLVLGLLEDQQMIGGQMRNPTKCCELTVILNSGARVTGTFHVSVGTDPNVRPADAIRRSDTDFLLLSDVTIGETEQPRQQQAILVQRDAIAYIELPTEGWTIRDVDNSSHGARDTMAGSQYLRAV